MAAVVIIVKNLLKDPVNQEYFLKRHGFAMLGKLLAKVYEIQKMSVVFDLGKNLTYEIEYS